MSESLTHVEIGVSPTKYKFINIKQTGQEMFGGHPVYRIYNNKSGDQLGIISWYTSWRQYVFSSQPDCAFNDSCLRDVLAFMSEATALTAEWMRQQKQVHP